MPTYQVTPAANKIVDRFSGSVELRNAGQNDIFVGLAPSGAGTNLSAGNRDRTIVAGGSQIFDAGTDIYVCCDTGVTSTVEVILNSAGSATPGPSTVFAKLSSIPVLIDSYQVTIPAAANANIISGAVLDISEYSSILIETQMGGGGSPVTEINWVSVQMTQREPTGANVFYTKTPQYLCESQGLLQVPVKKRQLITTAGWSKGATANQVSLLVKVYGSYQTIEKELYQSIFNTGPLNQIPYGGLASINGSGIATYQSFLGSLNGLSEMFLFKSANAQAISGVLYACNNGALAQLVGADVGTGAIFRTNIPATLPMRPILGELQIALAAANAGLVLAQQ